MNLGDEFSSPLGTFDDYVTYDGGQYTALLNQKHVNLRTLTPSTVSRLTMFDLDLLTMGELDSETMDDLDGVLPTRFDIQETWTAGTLGPYGAVRWPTLILPCIAGLNTTQSTLTFNGVTQSINISAFDTSADFITVACPSLPLASLTPGSCFLDITSAIDANFGAGPVASLPFTSSTVPLTNGNQELLFPLSALSGIDLTRITGVRFRIMATGSTTFRCSGIRVISETWKYAPLDFDTVRQRIVRPPARNADPSEPYEFPASPIAGLPPSWPILLRDKLKVIDTKCALWFNSGTTGVTPNDIALYFRALSQDAQTQLDLDGTLQSNLDALGRQPDYDNAQYVGRTQGDLDGMIQSQLDQFSQFQLERLPDPLSADWVKVAFSWGNTGGRPTISITDASGNGPTYVLGPAAIDENTDYLLQVEVVDEGLRLLIRKMDSIGNILSTIYDTLIWINGAIVRRRAGQFGWWANLATDAWIDSVRIRGANYGEYRTQGYNSITPVIGASLFVDAVPPQELVTTVFGGPFGGLVTKDFTRSASGNAYQIEINAGAAYQGFQTNTMLLEDFPETLIEFDVFFPADFFDGDQRPLAFLRGEYGRNVGLHIPPIKPNAWQHVKIYLDDTNTQTGAYRFALLQARSKIATSWYVDNISVKARVWKWEGRSRAIDAWGIDLTPWTPFDKTVSRRNGGIIFPYRGNSLQVRGRALRPDSQLSHVKIVPKYAQLGNFAWTSDSDTVNTIHPTIISSPDIVLTATQVDSLMGEITVDSTTEDYVIMAPAVDISFSATIVMPAGVTIESYLWDFGDGTQSTDVSPTYQYVVQGDRQVVLNILDSNGRVWGARLQLYVDAVIVVPDLLYLT